MSSNVIVPPELRGHGEILAGLWSSAAAERMPHALLFRGRAGIGKFLAMQRLARGLLCASGPGEPCAADGPGGPCGPCKRMLSGNHPDLFVVDAASEGEETMGVAFIADRSDKQTESKKRTSVEAFLRLVAHEGGWRIVLLREAERMNPNAQNAFLKTLEEPAQKTLIVLETSAPSDLLPTVRSRMIDVELAPLGPDDARAILVEHGLAADEAAELERWSRGAPGVALGLRARAAPEMREILQGVFLGRTAASVAAAEIWALEGDFPGKTPAGRHRTRARAALDLGLALLLDAERAAAGVPPATLAHGVHATDLCSLPAARRERCMEHWLLARQDVDLNLSPETLVERALQAAAPASATPR